MQRTKMVVTLGPATDDPAVLQACMEAGMHVARLNFSHADATVHARRVLKVRALANRLGRQVALMADLQGPKIRIGRFVDGKVLLRTGQSFVLDVERSALGDDQGVGVDYPWLVRDAQPGRVLLLDDGRIRCEVMEVCGSEVRCLVLDGGELSDCKGLNLQGGGLSADVITSKDRIDLHAALAMGVDYIALSFAKQAEDVHQIRALMEASGVEPPHVLVKIERMEAIHALESLVDAADAVMVARGDLAVEVGDAEVPVLQKRIIQVARAKHKPVVIATQMMESMIAQSTPTRAEVSDVANAVLDGADAVMLSAETAVGAHPATVVRAVARCCQAAERAWISQGPRELSQVEVFDRVDQAVAGAAMFVSNHLPIRAIVALTESGSTARWMSKFSCDIPVIALSRHARTLRRVQLYANVRPVYFDLEGLSDDALRAAMLRCCQAAADLKSGDWVVWTRGAQLGVGGLTNSLEVVAIE